MKTICYKDSEQYTTELLSSILNSIRKYDYDHLFGSVIVTGSFGRGEPTYQKDRQGFLKLKSDVEIAVVYDRGSSKNKIRKILKQIQSEYTEDLNILPIQKKRLCKAQNYNFTFGEPKYKTMFTYDLFNGSYTLWGEDYLSIKNVQLTEIDKYEAKRLVGNRIGELIAVCNNSQLDERLGLQTQWKGKLMLALGTAWLLCEDKYISSYRKQYEAVVSNCESIESCLGKGFVNEYSKIFAYLRDSGSEYEVPDEQLRDYVQHIDKIFKEMKLKSSKVNPLSKKMRMVIKMSNIHLRHVFSNFEDKILQELIDAYVEQTEAINYQAEIWHKVLYY